MDSKAGQVEDKVKKKNINKINLRTTASKGQQKIEQFYQSTNKEADQQDATTCTGTKRKNRDADVVDLEDSSKKSNHQKTPNATNDCSFFPDVNVVPSATMVSNKPENDEHNIEKLNKKPPPIIASNTTSAKLNSILSIVGKNQKSSITMKINRGKDNDNFFIQAEDTSINKTLIEELKKEKIEFFTYAAPEEQTNRFVIYGLYPMEIDELNELLNECGIEPHKSAQLKVKNTGVSYRSEIQHYIISFKKSAGITLDWLKAKADRIGHYRVKWSYFRNNYKNKNQQEGDNKNTSDSGKKTTEDHSKRKIRICSKCFNFGHSDRYCFKTQMCIRGDGDHDSGNCPLLKLNETGSKRVNADVLKCLNCNGKHTAISTSCPEREKYSKLLIKREEEQRRKNELRRQQVREQRESENASFVNAPQLKNFDSSDYNYTNNARLTLSENQNKGNPSKVPKAPASNDQRITGTNTKAPHKNNNTNVNPVNGNLGNQLAPTKGNNPKDHPDLMGTYNLLKVDNNKLKLTLQQQAKEIENLKNLVLQLQKAIQDMGIIKESAQTTSEKSQPNGQHSSERQVHVQTTIANDNNANNITQNKYVETTTNNQFSLLSDSGNDMETDENSEQISNMTNTVTDPNMPHGHT